MLPTSQGGNHSATPIICSDYIADASSVRRRDLAAGDAPRDAPLGFSLSDSQSPAAKEAFQRLATMSQTRQNMVRQRDAASSGAARSAIQGVIDNLDKSLVEADKSFDVASHASSSKAAIAAVAKRAASLKAAVRTSSSSATPSRVPSPTPPRELIFDEKGNAIARGPPRKLHHHGRRAHGRPVPRGIRGPWLQEIHTFSDHSLSAGDSSAAEGTSTASSARAELQAGRYEGQGVPSDAEDSSEASAP